MSLNAKNSVAVITGGSNGIGLAIAEEMIKAGAKGIVITGRNQERLDGAVKKLSDLSNTKVIGTAADAMSWEGNVELMKLANDTFGQIDYVFLNATGMQTGLDLQPLKKPDFGPAYSQIDSVLFGAHAATPYLASPNSTPVTEEGGEKPKRDRAIIITGSEGAFSGSDMSIFYSTGKGGLASYVMSSQHMFKDLGIRIGLVAPAFVLTGLTSDYAALGALTPDDLIPMDTVSGAYMRIVNDTSLTGVVTRIPNAQAKPFDVPLNHLYKSTRAFWREFAAKQAKESNGTAAGK